MAMDLEAAAAAFRILATHLRTAGEGGLRRDLYQAINDAAKPLAAEISSAGHLMPYMPDRYAGVLAADLSVSVSKLTGPSPAIRLRAVARMQARQGRRKVAWLDKGFINHPVYARGDRSAWDWSNGQTGGMKAGFFTDPCERAAPQVREAILAAMTEVADKVTRKT
jgi:hypothetical protein